MRHSSISKKTKTEDLDELLHIFFLAICDLSQESIVPGNKVMQRSFKDEKQHRIELE